jgi:hypothetical protein
MAGLALNHMAQLSTDRVERQPCGSLLSAGRLLRWVLIPSAIALPAAIAAQTSAQSIQGHRNEPVPVTVAVGPPSPQFRLPERLFISSGFRSIICPDAKSSATMLHNIGPGLPRAAKGSCRPGNKHIKIDGVIDRKTIRSVDGREAHYLAFRGKVWEAKGYLENVYGVLNETAHSRRGPRGVKDTISCPKRSTPIELIKGRQSMERDPSDKNRLRRLEALLSSCQPASGIFQPLAVLKRWERNGWVWTALKAQDGNGKIVSLLHNAPKPHIAPDSPPPLLHQD